MLHTNLFNTLKKSGHFIKVSLYHCNIVAGSYSTSLFLFEFNQRYIEESVRIHTHPLTDLQRPKSE